MKRVYQQGEAPSHPGSPVPLCRGNAHRECLMSLERLHPHTDAPLLLRIFPFAYFNLEFLWVWRDYWGHAKPATRSPPCKGAYRKCILGLFLLWSLNTDQQDHQRIAQQEGFENLAFITLNCSKGRGPSSNLGRYSFFCFPQLRALKQFLDPMQDMLDQPPWVLRVPDPSLGISICHLI